MVVGMVVVLLGGVDRMCFRDPRRMMVVVGMVVVVLLGGVDRMCFRDPRRMMVVVGMVVDVCNAQPPYGGLLPAAQIERMG